MILTHDGDSYECFAEFLEDLVEEEAEIIGCMNLQSNSMHRTHSGYARTQ